MSYYFVVILRHISSLSHYFTAMLWTLPKLTLVYCNVKCHKGETLIHDNVLILFGMRKYEYLSSEEMCFSSITSMFVISI